MKLPEICAFSIAPIRHPGVHEGFHHLCSQIHFFVDQIHRREVSQAGFATLFGHLQILVQKLAHLIQPPVNTPDDQGNVEAFGDGDGKGLHPGGHVPIHVPDFLQSSADHLFNVVGLTVNITWSQSTVINREFLMPTLVL